MKKLGTKPLVLALWLRELEESLLSSSTTLRSSHLSVFLLPSFWDFSTKLKPCENLIKKVFWLPAPVFIMGVVATGKSSHLSKPKSQEQRDFLRSSLTKKKTIVLFAEWPIIKLLNNKKQTSPSIKLSKLYCHLHSGWLFSTLLPRDSRRPTARDDGRRPQVF